MRALRRAVKLEKKVKGQAAIRLYVNWSKVDKALLANIYAAKLLDEDTVAIL